MRKILEQLAPFLGGSEGDPVPLDGGITNRNYRARLGGEDYVIRLPGKDTSLLGIDRSVERAASEAAAEIGIAPPVAALLESPPCLVTRFVVGRGMEPAELQNGEAMVEIARSLRRYHDCGAVLGTEFNSFRIVEDYAELAGERGAELPSSYEEAHRHAAEIEAAFTGSEHAPVPCHDDLLAANFLATDDGIRIVDWEYAGMGDRYFDLGNFAVNNELSAADEPALLAAYLGEEPGPQRIASLRLMRFMSDFREAMWGVVQSVVSELDFDFDGYAAKHFERMAETAAAPEFGRQIEEARAS